MPTLNKPIAVLGAGSWGTALALLLARNGHQVRLWAYKSDCVAQMIAERCNRRYLPDHPFPANVQPVADLSTVRECAAVLLAVPSNSYAGLLRDLAPHLAIQTPVICATKGFETGTGRLLHQVFAERCDDSNLRYATLSGPTFAAEVAKGLPTALTLAAERAELRAELSQLLHDENFRVYTTGDIVGVELGGASKNIFAIAAGVCDGLGFGANARAALITRSVAEMMRLGAALGGQRETFMGLAGVGDLILTCTENQSRNRRFGLALARGDNVEHALQEIGQVVEGISAAREVRGLAQRHGIDMPIVMQVNAILDGQCTPRDAVRQLLQREPKAEQH